MAVIKIGRGFYILFARQGAGLLVAVSWLSVLVCAANIVGFFGGTAVSGIFIGGTRHCPAYTTHPRGCRHALSAPISWQAPFSFCWVRGFSIYARSTQYKLHRTLGEPPLRTYNRLLALPNNVWHLVSMVTIFR